MSCEHSIYKPLLEGQQGLGPLSSHPSKQHAWRILEVFTKEITRPMGFVYSMLPICRFVQPKTFIFWVHKEDPN